MTSYRRRYVSVGKQGQPGLRDFSGSLDDAPKQMEDISASQHAHPAAGENAAHRRSEQLKHGAVTVAVPANSQAPVRSSSVPPEMTSSGRLAVTIRVPDHDGGKCLRFPVTK